MRKELEVQPAVFPMPVLIVAAYDEAGTVQAMNAVWGTICGMDRIALCIDEGHATTKAIRQTGAFTASIADVAHMDVADYYGIATGNKLPDKFAKSGYHAVRSGNVNAPIIEEFPLAMECELAEVVQTENMHAVVGCIVGVSVDEKVLGADGKVDPVKLDALTFDQFGHGYYATGEKVGLAWNAGVALAKAARGK
ncbi:MAG: flavin reductase family protein [Acidobacteriota bacterium]|nr:flavin reductase family protein [Acidobacteriota bacterium]